MSSGKLTNVISRQRSSSLKDKLFLSRDRRTSYSLRARLPSHVMSNNLDADLATTTPPITKFKLVTEASVRIHVIDPVESTRNIIEKLFSKSKFPWNWDLCTIILGEDEIYSTTPVTFFTKPIPYENIEEVSAICLTRQPLKYIRVRTKEITFMIQTPDTYQRDRWIHSVQWKCHVHKTRKILFSANRSEVIIQELQKFVNMAVQGPLHIDDTYSTLLEIVSHLLNHNNNIRNSLTHETLIMTLAPLFDKNQPSIEICNFFTKHCRDCPRSRVVIDMFTPAVLRILKYNANFGRNMWLRNFVKEYIQALNARNEGEEAVRAFVQAAHGPLTICPHNRILNNLVAICFAAIYECFCVEKPSQCEKSKPCRKPGKMLVKAATFDLSDGMPSSPEKLNNANNVEQKKIPFTSHFSNILIMNKNRNLRELQDCIPEEGVPSEHDIQAKKENINLKEYHVNKKDKILSTTESTESKTADEEIALLFTQVLCEISTINDWLPGLATLLQPIPFDSQAMKNEKFVGYMVKIIERMMEDGRDQVIWSLLSSRKGKDGWLQICSPQSNIVHDEGKLFVRMTESLLESAKKSVKTKNLVTVLLEDCFNAVTLLALRESKVMIEVLCLILEYHLVMGQKEHQIISTLRSTNHGKEQYERLCKQETILRQKGGPVEYTLPPRSTDKDLETFLSVGSFGNLQKLNLSFTDVSSDSAEVISKLPALQHLNLWSSRMSDVGLRRICECLNLKTLNLCETWVTDDSIICLKDMTSLTDLNLNSTPVSDSTYRLLRSSLPNLTHCNISYTEAWPDTVDVVPNNNVAPKDEMQKVKKLEYEQNIH